MKNHQYVNGRLLQTNKTFDMLKQRQKEKIADWLYESYKKHMTDCTTTSKADVDIQIVEEVLEKIKDAEIWIPDGEVYGYYERKKNHFRKRLERDSVF